MNIPLFFLSCSTTRNMQETKMQKEYNQEDELNHLKNQSQNENYQQDTIKEPEPALNNFPKQIDNELLDVYMNILFYPNKKKGKPIDSFMKFAPYFIYEGNELTFTLYLEEGRTHIFDAYSNCPNITISIIKTRPSVGQEQFLKPVIYWPKYKHGFHVVNYLSSERGEYKIKFKFGKISPQYSSERGFFVGDASVISNAGEDYYKGFYKVKEEITGSQY